MENTEKEENPKLFFLTTRDKKGTWIYESEAFFLTEWDLLSMLKILLADRRLVSAGRKILAVYEDAMISENRDYESNLNKIGIKKQHDDKPIKSGRNKTK